MSRLESVLNQIFALGISLMFSMSCDFPAENLSASGDPGEEDDNYSMPHPDSDADGQSDLPADDCDDCHEDDDVYHDTECEPVTIQDAGLYWNVVLDYGCGVSRRDMGYLYAEKIFQVVPEIQQLVDEYLNEEFYGLGIAHGLMLSRIDDVLPQVDAELRNELEGLVDYLVDVVHKGVIPPDKVNDGIIGRKELYFLNLFPDVGRIIACSGLSVFGSRSATGSPLLIRLLDWSSGSRNQLNKLQAITTIKNGSKSVSLVGFLGMLSVITAFNEDGVFAAILDSSTGAPYPMWGSRNSYVFDLRYAMENYSNLNDVADYMRDKKRVYSYNHNILLADKKSSKVLENNMSGFGLNMRRALRSWDSELHLGVTWGIKDAIGVVNSFLLRGNHNNHSLDSWNVQRFRTMKSVLVSKGEKIDKQDLKEISYESKMYDLGWTQHIVVFEPATLSAEVFFNPQSRPSPKVPTFEVFNVKF